MSTIVTRPEHAAAGAPPPALPLRLALGTFTAVMRPAVLLVLSLLGVVPALADFQRTPLPFYHENASVPQIKELRDRYDFDEYVARGKTELEQMFLLQDWVYTHVAYGGAPEFIDLRDSFAILDMASRGEEFWCNNLAAVYLQCAVSLGWTARYIFLRSPHGDAHVTNDIWSNELRKWIMIDATWNLHVERDGVPLSIAEVREEWNRKGMAGLDYIFGAGEHEQRYTVADMPIERTDSKLWHWWPVDESWINFTHAVAYVMRNDFFAIENGNGGSIWSGIVTIRDSSNANDEFWEFRQKPGARDMRSLYPDVNRVDLRLVPEVEPGAAEERSPLRLFRRTPPPAVRIRLDAFGPYNYTPNLAGFKVQVNGGAWRDSGAELDVVPQAGVNHVRARIVNAFGVLGPITDFDFAWKAGSDPVPLLPATEWGASAALH